MSGPIAAIRRSWELFKQTWGDRVHRASRHFGGELPGAVAAGPHYLWVWWWGAIALGSVPLIILAVPAGDCGLLVAIALITGAINDVFQAPLYHYARTGNAGRFIDSDLSP